MKNYKNYNHLEKWPGRGRLRAGSNYRALTGKNLVFWIGGRLWEVVAYERWSHMEVRLLTPAGFEGLRTLRT